MSIRPLVDTWWRCDTSLGPLACFLGTTRTKHLLGARVCEDLTLALDLSTFMSIHRLSLLSIATLWLGVDARVGPTLGLRAIKLLGCQLAISD